jgi:proline dehydrogenase
MDLNFRDTSIAFQSHSNASLKRSYWLFKTLASPRLVAMGKMLTLKALQWRLPIKGLIRSTVFKQFCGGETAPECTSVAQRNWTHGVGSILDYSVEGQKDPDAYQQTVEMTIQTLALASKEDALPLGVFKVTGLADTRVLEKVSAGIQLKGEEELAWQQTKERVDQICHFAHEKKVPIMFDAEESWIQPAIDTLAYNAMRAFNQETVIIYNTIQCYRTGRLAHLEKQLQRAKKEGYGLGIKFVRGAYMEKERDRAKEMGYLSPIQPDKASTDLEFNRCVTTMLQSLGGPGSNAKLALMIGSHNEESALIAANLLVQAGWEPQNAPVWFAQLYGMSDHISFNLAHHGFKVAKYLPFGPIEKVMPYLFRRAEENTSVKGQTGRELGLIKAELQRRKNAKSTGSQAF